MIPQGLGRPLQTWNNSAPPAGAASPRSSVLTINFVRVAQGRVTGRLAPYADPETGVQLFTAFEGQLRGDVIEGTYTTRAARTVVRGLQYRLDVNSLHRDETATSLSLNEIGRVKLRTTVPLLADEYRRNRTTGGFIIIDETSNRTVGAGMIIEAS